MPLNLTPGFVAVFDREFVPAMAEIDTMANDMRERVARDGVASAAISTVHALMVNPDVTRDYAVTLAVLAVARLADLTQETPDA